MKIINIYLLTILVFSGGCLAESTDDETPVPVTPVFPDTTRIELQLPAHQSTVTTATEFMWDESEDLSIVFAVFSSQPVVDANTLKISNNESIVAGTHTGREGLSRGSLVLSETYVYNPDTDRFTEEKFLPPAGTYYWCLWGFKGAVLKYSSPVWQFTIE